MDTTRKLPLWLGGICLSLGLLTPAWASDGTPEQARPQSPQVLQYTCKYIEAQDALRYLNKLLPEPDAVRLDDGKTIRVTGSASTLALARDIIQNVDVAGPEKDSVGPAVLRTYSVAGNRAVTMAQTLQKAFKSATITNAGHDAILVYGNSRVQGAVAKWLARPQPAATAHEKTGTDVIPVGMQTDGKGQPGTQLVDPKAPKQDNPGTPMAPVTITALGNKLYVHSDDPEALKLVQDMTRLLTTAPSGKGDFEIIHLKNGMAADVAKILEDAFNGPKETTPQGPAAFFMRMRGIPQPEAKPPAIRVVADPASNSLLVQASPLNMLTIRRLLGDALDAADTDSNAVMQTFTVQLKHAEASDVAAVLKDVYKERMNSNSNSRFGFGRGRFRFAAMNTENKPTTLTVGVDDRTNSVILNCPQLLYTEISKLIEKLDNGAAETTPMVSIIPVVGVDPMMLQETLDAMQGLGTVSPLNGARGTSFPGGMMMGGFGGRGFGGRGAGGRGSGGGGFGGRGFGGGGGGFGGRGGYQGGGGRGGYQGGGGGRGGFQGGGGRGGFQGGRGGFGGGRGGR